MVIENPAALRVWLSEYLAPLTDACPDQLAKYVLALVKKKEPPYASHCNDFINQLDVFLHDETRPFVERLIEVIESHSYLPATTQVTPTKIVSHVPTTPHNNSPDSTTASSNLNSFPISTGDTTEAAPPLPPLPTINIPPPPPETTPPRSLQTLPLRKDDVTSTEKSKKADYDRDVEDRKFRRRLSNSPKGRSRSKSRSRSRDRNRRSRSRGRGIRSKYDDRRRRSPGGRRYRRSRSHSPQLSRSPWRSRSQERRSRSRHRSHSSSPKRSGRSQRNRIKSRSPVGNSVAAKTSDAEKLDAPPTHLQSVVTVPKQDYSSKKQRCRDYDEKGYCVRGELCPYDHGADPVVLEDLSGVLELPPPVCSSMQFNALYNPVTTVTAQGPRLPVHSGKRNFQTQYGEYTPNDPGIWSSSQQRHVEGAFYQTGVPPVPPLRFSVPPPSYFGSGRELINITVDDGNTFKGSSRGPVTSRLGPLPISSDSSYQAPRVAANSCTLELRKIPAGLNSISHLNNHFAKFGTIVNIQVQHDNDLEAALVTFSSHSEANAAYRSTEAVLNNRFIKLFWHNPKPLGENALSRPHLISEAVPIKNANKAFKKPQLEMLSGDQLGKVVVSGGSLVKTVYNNSTVVSPTKEAPSLENPVAALAEISKTKSAITAKKIEVEAILRQREILANRIAVIQKVEKKKADTLKLKTDIEKRQRQLLEKQIQQLKLLMTRFETQKGSMKMEEKKQLLSTIKSLQTAIETTKMKLPNAGNVPGKKPSGSKTKVQLDKEILDTELELYSIQGEGGDSATLRNRLSLLEAEKVKTLKASITTPRDFTPYQPLGRSRGMGYVYGGSMRGRGRGRGYLRYNSFDRYTRKINASGFEREDKNEVIAHFNSFGMVTQFKWDDQTPAMTVSYATRKEAERALTEGRVLGDRLLTLTWVTDNQYQVSVPPVSSAKITAPTSNPNSVPASTITQDDDSLVDEITEEIVEEVEMEDEEGNSVVYEEEEEDNEDEERSWRR